MRDDPAERTLRALLTAQMNRNVPSLSHELLVLHVTSSA